jgi:hypothetical protein
LEEFLPWPYNSTVNIKYYKKFGKFCVYTFRVW